MFRFIYCYAECNYAERRYAECLYTERRGTLFVPDKLLGYSCQTRLVAVKVPALFVKFRQVCQELSSKHSSLLLSHHLIETCRFHKLFSP